MEDRVLRNISRGKKQEVGDHRRNVKLSKNKTSVTACNDSLNTKTLNVKYVSMCDKCVLHDKHDMCVLKSVAKPIKRTLVEIVLFIVDSRCSKHIAGNLKLLINFVEKFLGTVKFGYDQIAPILGYGDLVQGAITTKRVYYVEWLNHNLFSVGQFCDADLEVAFRKSTCFIRDLKGNDLLTGSRRADLYSITLQDTNSPNPICLVAKATSSQAWLWHRLTPVLSTEEPDNSLSLGDEHLDTIPAMESDEVIKSSVENLIPIPRDRKLPKYRDEHLDTIPATKSDEVIKSSVKDLVPIPSESEEVAEIVIPEDEEIKDDNLGEKLLNVHLLIANIEALKDNPTPSSELLIKKGAHTGYNCPPKVPIISNPEPCNQTMNNELPQTLPSFDPTCYSDKENSVPCVSKPNFVDESSYNFNPPPQPPIYSCEFYRSNAQYGHYCTPQVPFINPEPGYSQDLNFPQNIHDFQQ
nr:integrase, catalytic region, zinc finger, CCHC-type, peptidase aspartic, catalytic [Tanacetum cinerariifolium]